MFNRTQACAALIICTSVAFAQDAATPPLNSSAPSSYIVPSPTSGMEIPVNNFGMQPGTDSSSTPTELPKPQEVQKEGFSLPGGFGYAPVDFVPGEGRFDRKPLTFSTTVQQGYDDNVYAGNSYYNSDGSAQNSKKGSLVSHLSQGVDLLLAQSRLGLSLSANGGGQYYWSRNGDKLTPNGDLDLLFAYKLSPRMQFSALVNGSYTTQPSLSVLNGLVQSSNKGSLLMNSKLDLLYRWTPRFSTDTTYSTDLHNSQDSTSDNLTTQTVGQSFRYTFSRRVTGVVEGRVAQNSYDSSTNDSNTYFALVGADVTISRRLMGTLRVGETIQDYKTADMGSSSLPYFETALNYNWTKKAVIGFQARYGFDANYATQERKNFRTGVTYAYMFSSRLRGTASANYSHSSYDETDFFGYTNSATDEAYSGSLGLEYVFTKNLTLFGSFSSLKSVPNNKEQEYTKNVTYIGATYQY